VAIAPALDEDDDEDEAHAPDVQVAWERGGQLLAVLRELTADPREQRAAIIWAITLAGLGDLVLSQLAIVQRTAVAPPHTQPSADALYVARAVDRGNKMLDEQLRAMSALLEAIASRGVR
jgi:hypothetical protein